MKSMIVAPQPLAVEQGALTLMRGGNAIDAAVTCAFVQAIVDPQMCGIGGYGLAALTLAGDPTVRTYDAQALSGGKTTPDMWAHKVIGLSPDGWGYFLQGFVNDAGYTSICTPGWVRLMSHLLATHGTISWEAAIAPAATIAEQGFMVTDRLSRDWRKSAPYPQALSLADYIRRNPEASRIYANSNGELPAVGETVTNPDYARTLRHLATRGADDFYTGDLALKISSDLAANGASVTSQDLASYKLTKPAPDYTSYRGYKVHSSTAPHGGTTVLAILNIVAGWDLRAMGHNSPEYIYKVAMAMKAAFADRNRFMADPKFVAVPTQWMLSPERATQWRDHIDAGREIEAMPFPTGQPNTTHVTVVDKLGNCVALTHSLGNSSGVVTPGLGFIYNNSMINFDPLPGHPNSIAPGKGRTTGMAPTLVFKNGAPILVLGAPGASRIITSVLQVLLNVLDFGMSASDAVLAPRFDCQINLIRCQRRIPSYVLDEVRARHPIIHLPYSHGEMGRVHAISIDPVTGGLTGGAEVGNDGMALEV